MTNPFWVDVISAWAEYNCCWNKTTEDLLTEQIWFSDCTPYSSSVVRDWDDRGLRFIIDLIDPNLRQFRSRENIMTRYGIRMNFLNYQCLIRRVASKVQIAGQWRVDTNAPIFPSRLKAIYHDSSLGKTGYNAFVQNIYNKNRNHLAKTEQKWLRDVGKFDEGTVVDIMRCTASSYLRWFHYRLVNRIITTNLFLNMINQRDDDLCSFCSRNSENLIHLFCRCTVTRTFLNEVCNFLQSKGIAININEGEFLFPSDNTNLENLTALLAKVVIYRARCKECLPSLSLFKAVLKYEAIKERYIARLYGKEELFNNKWEKLVRNWEELSP